MARGRTGPRDLEHHSKWPEFLRLYGSITPAMILPLLFVAAWATVITSIHKYFYDVTLDKTLLTILGIVVAFTLKFRSTTAYERYSEGRKYWAQLTLASNNLARLVWVHVDEQLDDPDVTKKGLLAKLTCLNMIEAFAVALKHRLRFEPYAIYGDLKHLVCHLDTFAGAVECPNEQKLQSTTKFVGRVLGVPMARSNPRKVVKRAKEPLGNLPLEILTYLSSYEKFTFEEGTFRVNPYRTQFLSNVSIMNDVLVGTDRILNTPIPIAYTIAISQITWAYVMFMPLHLVDSFGWGTIPGSVFAAYVMLGLAIIGREIENPFGDDVSDLPLDVYCAQIRNDIDIITSKPAASWNGLVMGEANKVLYPSDHLGARSWADKSIEDMRQALSAKPKLSFKNLKRKGVEKEDDPDGDDVV